MTILFSQSDLHHAQCSCSPCVCQIAVGMNVGHVTYYFWISSYSHYEMWDQITYQFPKLNGCTVEVWEWISNISQKVYGHVITYPHVARSLKYVTISCILFIKCSEQLKPLKFIEVVLRIYVSVN